jgi:hypothetical protein
MVNKTLENKDKKFWIHPDDFNKVIQYASSAYNQFKSEIGGQMVVVEDAEGDYILKEPVILEQEISASNCTMTAEALALHYSKMMQKHGKKVRHCWWHSHHTMNAFWSGTDNATILETPSKDWTVSLVVNLKKEYKLRIQFFQPFLHEENVELNFLTEEQDADPEIDNLVKKLCKKEVIATTYYNGVNRAPVKPRVYNYGQQTNLLPMDYTTNDEDMVEYNRSFGVDYYGNTMPKDDVDFDKLTQQQIVAFEQEVDDLTDTVSHPTNLDQHNMSSLALWKQGKKKLDKKLKPFNLRLKAFKTSVELDGAIMSYFVNEYFENIHKPERMVN